MTYIKVRSEHRIFGGTQGFYEANSRACGGPMRFSVFVPPGAYSHNRVPALYFLAGLTCTEEQLPVKVAAQRVAAELGLALVACDTSPRAARYPEDDTGGFGLGAGFYVDATEAPWSATYKLETHLLKELPNWIEEEFPVVSDRRGIWGHSMGGHGALTLALKHPEFFTSVSAFAPIVAPSQVPWGQTAFRRYFGEAPALWAKHDACELVKQRQHPSTLLIDQGLADPFLTRELQPERFEAACVSSGQKLALRRRPDYDHSYYFIQTFAEEHLRHHASVLA